MSKYLTSLQFLQAAVCGHVLTKFNDEQTEGTTNE